MNYATPPIVVGSYCIPDTEMVFSMYLPVRLTSGPVCVPENLSGYTALVNAALEHEGATADGKYVYLTTKRLYVEPGCVGGRAGWHIDGFGTDDVNYIWCDADPTEFCVQDFLLSRDHQRSMIEMTEQARAENIVTYSPLDLIRIDNRHVHRCPPNPTPGVRTFAKVSISPDKYDLIGNAHNYGLRYNWIMHPRASARNDTSATREATQ